MNFTGLIPCNIRPNLSGKGKIVKNQKLTTELTVNFIFASAEFMQSREIKVKYVQLMCMFIAVLENQGSKAGCYSLQPFYGNDYKNIIRINISRIPHRVVRNDNGS